VFENECGCTFHQDLVEGKVYEAKVVKVLDIGVVVGIGCVCCFIVPSSRAKVDLPHCGAYGFRPNEGLLHISEIAHSRTTPEEIHSTFSVGDPVTVMCTEVVCVVLSIVCFSSIIILFPSYTRAFRVETDPRDCRKRLLKKYVICVRHSASVHESSHPSESGV